MPRHTRCRPHRLSRRTRLGAAGILVCGLLNPPPAWPQSTSSDRRFEVASIKERVDVGAQQAGIEDTPNQVRIVNLPLDGVIGIAYGVMRFQLVAPDWTTRARFDIVGKPPAGYTSADLRPLLRNLLADRFNLSVHHETKPVTGYALRISAGGHRLPAATGARGFFTARPGLISGTNRTVAELVTQLTQMVGAPVTDQTGLTGGYDLKLEWTPDLPSAPAASPDVSIFTALREQMGLRLEPATVTTEVVVVDRIERPTEN